MQVLLQSLLFSRFTTDELVQENILHVRIESPGTRLKQRKDVNHVPWKTAQGFGLQNQKVTRTHLNF